MSLLRQNHQNIAPKPIITSKPKMNGYQQKYQNSQASSYITALGQQLKRKKTHSSHSFQSNQEQIIEMRPRYINVRSSLEQQQQQQYLLQQQQQQQLQQQQQKQQEILDPDCFNTLSSYGCSTPQNPYGVSSQLIGGGNNFLDISRNNVNDNSMVVHTMVDSPSPVKNQNANYSNERNGNASSFLTSGIVSLRKSLESRINQSRLNQSFERNEGNNNNQINTSFKGRVASALRTSQERQEIREKYSSIRFEEKGRGNKEKTINLEKQNKKPLVEDIIETILQGGKEEQRRELDNMKEQIHFLQEQNANLIALQQNQRGEIERLNKSIQSERQQFQEKNYFLNALQKEIEEKNRSNLPMQEDLKALVSEIFEVSFISFALSKEQHLQQQLMTGETATFILLIQNKLKEIMNKLSPFVHALNMQSYLAEKGNRVRSELELEIIKAKTIGLKIQSDQLISPQSKIESAFPLKKKFSSSFESTQHNSGSYNRMHSRQFSSNSNSYENYNKNFQSFQSNEKEGNQNCFHSSNDQYYQVAAFDDGLKKKVSQQLSIQPSDKINQMNQFEVGKPAQAFIKLEVKQFGQPNFKNINQFDQEFKQSQIPIHQQSIKSNTPSPIHNNYNNFINQQPLQYQQQNQQLNKVESFNSYQIPFQIIQQTQQQHQQINKQNSKDQLSENLKQGNPLFFGQELCPTVEQLTEQKVFSTNQSQPFFIEQYLQENNTLINQQLNINSFGKCSRNLEDNSLYMMNTQETEPKSGDRKQEEENNQSQPYLKEIQLSTLSPCFNGTSRENSKRSLAHSNKYSSLKNNNININNNNNQTISGATKIYSRSRLSQIQLGNFNNRPSISYDALRRVKTEADDNIQEDLDLGFAFSCNDLFAPESQQEMYIAKHDYQKRNKDGISFKKDDKIIITVKNQNGWWFGECGDRKGYLPKNFITPLKNN